MANSYNNTRLRDLIRPDCVHKDVYLDPALFRLELQRIFSRSWHYLCYAGQLPEPGDYRYHLRREAGGYKISLKRVDLINADACHEPMQVFI